MAEKLIHETIIDNDRQQGRPDMAESEITAEDWFDEAVGTVIRTTPKDGDFSWLLQLVDGTPRITKWAIADSEYPILIALYCLGLPLPPTIPLPPSMMPAQLLIEELRADGILGMGTPTTAAVEFMEEIDANKGVFQIDLGDISSLALYKKYINSNLNSINNPFKEGTPTRFERSRGVLGEKSGPEDDDYGLDKFSDRTLKYLQGESPSGKIFDDHDLIKPAWEQLLLFPNPTAPWVEEAGDAGEEDWLKGIISNEGAQDASLFVDMVSLDQLKFRDNEKSVEEGFGYYDKLVKVLVCLWAGHLPGEPVTPRSFLNYAENLFESVTNSVAGVFGVGPWDLGDANTYSRSLWRPVNWAEIFTDDYLDPPVRDEAKLETLMPAEITVTGTDDKLSEPLTNITGVLKDDVGMSDKNWTSEEFKPLHELLLKESKQPKTRLEPDFYKDMKEAYPTSGNEALDMTLNDLDGDTIKELKVKSIKIISKPKQLVDYSGLGFHFDSNLMRRFYMAFYFQYLHYYMIENNHNDQGYSVDDIFDYVAYKTAIVLSMIWTQYVHDTKIATIYSAIVALYKYNPDAAAKALADLAAGLLDEAEEKAEDALQETAGQDDPETGEATTVNKDQRERLYKQCALMLNMHDPLMWMKNKPSNMASNQFHSKNIAGGYGSYNHRVHVVTSGEPNPTATPTRQNNNIVNRLICPKASLVEPFLDIKNDQVASIIPYVKLFKVHTHEGVLTETEFEFPTRPGLRDLPLGVSSLFESKFDRGDGVGLKEFKWELDGETPATASKYIKAQLTLFFQTFTDFTAVRTNKNGIQYRYVDLFVSPVGMKEKKGKFGFPHSLHYDPEYYRIKVEVGHKVDPNSGTPINDPSGSVKNALKLLRRTFCLVLVDNEINVNEDGTVHITGDYRAYIEEAMDSYKFNALNSRFVREEKEKWRSEWRKAIGEEANDKGEKKKCNDRDLSILRNKIDGKMRYLTSIQYRSIINQLLCYKRIFWMDFDPDAIDNFRKTGTFDGIPAFDTGASTVSSAAPTAAEQFKKWMESQKKADADKYVNPSNIAGDYRVYYFYLGDLIYILASNLYKNGTEGTGADYLPGAENTKIILTDFQYYNPLDVDNGTVKVLNIADIPINVDYFFQWYINSVVKANASHVSIGTFIRKLLTELVTEALAEVCTQTEPGNYTSFKICHFMAGGIRAGESLLDPIQGMLKLEKDGGEKFPDRLNVLKHYEASANAPGIFLPLTNIPADESGIENQWNYVTIYGDFKNPAHPGRGNREADHKNSTYHLNIGRDRGLVKKVSFSKNNIKHHRESRMFNQGQAGLLQLSAVYNCQVSMIGNSLFLPGMEFWLNPYGFGGEAFGKPQDPPLTKVIPPSIINSRQRAIQSVMSGQPGDKTPATIDAVEMEKINTIDQDLAKTYGISEENYQRVMDEAQAEDEGISYINSYANVMGIGGYQQVIRVENKISPGEYSTTIHGIHTFTGLPGVTNSNKLNNQGTQNVKDADVETDDAACDAVIRELWKEERER